MGLASESADTILELILRLEQETSDDSELTQR